MTARDDIDAALAVCDKAGVPVKEMAADLHGVTVEFASCAEYVAACRAAKAKGGRTHQSARALAEHRIHEVMAGRLVLVHRCWPHLPCWGTDLRDPEPAEPDLFSEEAS